MRYFSWSVLLLCSVLFFPQKIFAQKKASPPEIGMLPRITHYSREDFEGDTQFWTMTRDQQGKLYFGNNDGVLIYNGERWEKIVLPNSSSVRSLTTSSSGKVYAGGYNELGIIQENELGQYQYVSLLGKLELENQKLENLWQVHEFRNHIIFRSFNELLVISGTTATHIASSSSFIHSAVVNDRFYVQDSETGILQFEPQNMQLKKLFQASDFQHNEMVAILPHTNVNELLLAAKNGVIYKANIASKKVTVYKNLFENQRQEQIISAVEHNDNYLLGTLSSGVVVLTKEGMLIEDSPAFDKVHDSSILQLYRDGENVWALLNNGLDLIEFNTPVSHLFHQASIYDILIEDDRIYLATNQGVFHSELPGTDLSDSSFRFHKVPDLEGQAWSIKSMGGSILVGHDKGLFELNNQQAHKIGEEDGFWKVIPIEGYPDHYMAANYNGLYLLSHLDNQWQLEHRIKGFDESTRDILQADQENTFWVCHGYKGVYKLKFSEDYSRVYALDQYTDQNGLDSPFNINVTRWNDEIVFTTNTGIFQFSESSNTFEPHEYLNSILDPDYNTRTLVKGEERFWVVQDDEIGYFDKNQASPPLHKELFRNLKGDLNRGMESILPLGNDKVLIGATTGLYLYDLKKQEEEKFIDTQLSQVSYLQNEEEVRLPLKASGVTDLPPRTDILRFQFASPKASSSFGLQYQYILEGIDKQWSAWESESQKEYTHLPPGDYTFKVRSRDLTGNIAGEAGFNFYIPSPWYQSTLAYICYFLFLVLVVILIAHLLQEKIKKERREAKIAAQKTEKLLELEIQQLKLQQDKESIKRDKLLLQEDNILKSKELANYTMLLVKKKDILTETYDNLVEFRKSLKTQAARKRLQNVLFKLNQHRVEEEYMNVFDVHFEKIHQNFFEALKNLNPKITQRELRLCAFVKMNLTNKEIAPLLNISVRGVETARYRVRKKLGVQESNFSEFLEELVMKKDEVAIDSRP